MNIMYNSREEFQSKCIVVNQESSPSGKSNKVGKLKKHYIHQEVVELIFI